MKAQNFFKKSSLAIIYKKAKLEFFKNDLMSLEILKALV